MGGPTIGDLIWIVGGVVSFTIFMIVKDDLLSWAGRFVKGYGHRPVTLMSSVAHGQPNDRRIDTDPVNALSALQSCNGVNERQPVNASPVNAQHDISSVADHEKILQYRERLATLADMINGGSATQAEGIETAFGCTRSGRKDSKYAQIRADLLPLLKSKEQLAAITPIAGRSTNAVFVDSDLDYQPPGADCGTIDDDADLTYRAP